MSDKYIDNGVKTMRFNEVDGIFFGWEEGYNEELGIHYKLGIVQIGDMVYALPQSAIKFPKYTLMKGFVH